MDPRHADTDPREQPPTGDVLGELRDSAKRLAAAEGLRLRSRLERGAMRAATAAALGILGVAALLMAGIQLARGLAGAITALVDGPAWLGELSSGLILPALLLLGLAWANHRRARARIERARSLRDEAQASVHSMPSTRDEAAA